jgi:hypothetical protein
MNHNRLSLESESCATHAPELSLELSAESKMMERELARSMNGQFSTLIEILSVCCGYMVVVSANVTTVAFSSNCHNCGFSKYAI